MTLEPHATEPATVVAHPLAESALVDLRDVATGHVAFRRCLTRLGRVCGYALAGERFPTDATTVETPLGRAAGVRITDDLVLVAVLRAAIPFVDGLLDAVPQARQGVVSASRDEHAGPDGDGRFPVEARYVHLPRIRPTDTVVVADPMLASGSTMEAVLEEVREGGQPTATLALAAVCAPEGIRRVARSFPDVEVVTVDVDEGLDANGFIVPGLGDAGDRAFGTDG